jgi:hypothetical protein
MSRAAMFGRPRSKSIEFEVVNDSDATVQYQIADRRFSLPPGYSETHQQCCPADVLFVFRRPGDAQGSTRMVKPHSGDHFVIADDEGRLRVDKR